MDIPDIIETAKYLQRLKSADIIRKYFDDNLSGKIMEKVCNEICDIVMNDEIPK